jgi:histone deacetylase 1/2
METHGVWTVTDRTPKMKPIPLKWIHTVKHDGTRKSRLVVVGCKDTENYTKEEKASPTPQPIIFRWILTLAVINSWELIQLDIKNAFLNGIIDREKYVTIPPGMSYDPKKYVCKLNKALYGLATAPLCWFRTIDSYLHSINFETSPREPCVYRKKNPNNPNLITIIVLYVDDILLTGSDSEMIQTTLNNLSSRFQLRNLGYPKRFVGIQIEKCNNGSVFLHQEKYIGDVLTQFSMQNSHPVKTPIVPVHNHKILQSDTEKIFPYKQALGCLQFLANYTRLDIAYAVAFLARYQSDPQPIHWAMVKRIFRYLQGTRRTGIKIDCNNPEMFDAFSDADHGAEKLRRSTTAFVIRMYGCPIAWCSRLQRSIAESTSEAEYKAINETAHELMYITQLTEELIHPVPYPITIYEDNIGAIRQCKTPVTNRSRIKHVELQFFKVREYVKNNRLKIVQVPTTAQLADLLTKPLLEEPFARLCGQLLNTETTQ